MEPKEEIQRLCLEIVRGWATEYLVPVAHFSHWDDQRGDTMVVMEMLISENINRAHFV